MVYCDKNPSIVEWSSEEIVIPYLSPKDGNMHRYFPDFWIKVVTHDGRYEECLVEVKPKSQTVPPKLRKRKTKRYLEECITYEINQAKWASAETYCKNKNMKFLKLTEDDLLP